MASKQVYVDLGMNDQAIRSVKIDDVAADPGSPVEGQVWYNTTDDRMRYYDGVQTRDIAHLDDLDNLGRFQGGHDASSGVPSGVGVEAGDYWRITTAGTIVGQASGNDSLEVGDLLFANVDTPAGAADFFSIQVNVDVPSAFAVSEIVTLASLPANTPTVQNAATVTNIHSYMILDSAGRCISVAVQKTGAAQLTLESNVALTNVQIGIVGAP